VSEITDNMEKSKEKMTDLEKAIELAKKHEGLFGIRNREECCVAACQEMAEWKEQQMIDKACEFISEWFYEHPHKNMVCSNEFECVDDLLERFKKVME